MKKRLIIGIIVALTASANAKTNTFYVAEGQTLTVDQVVSASNFTFAAGDWLRKTGRGQLDASATYKDTKINLLIEEGVYYVNAIVHTQGGTMIVKNGATFKHGGFKGALAGSWSISFEGSGTGEGDCLGAVAVGGGTTDSLLDTGASWTMTGDATIYTYGTMNAIFSGTGPNGGPTLNMNGHTLTIRGKNSSSVFRPRWRLGISNSGPIVVRNGQFARQTVQNPNNDISPNIPLISFRDGALMASHATSFPRFGAK